MFVIPLCLKHESWEALAADLGLRIGWSKVWVRVCRVVHVRLNVGSCGKEDLWSLICLSTGARLRRNTNIRQWRLNEILMHGHNGCILGFPNRKVGVGSFGINVQIRFSSALQHEAWFPKSHCILADCKIWFEIPPRASNWFSILSWRDDEDRNASWGERVWSSAGNVTFCGSDICQTKLQIIMTILTTHCTVVTNYQSSVQYNKSKLRELNSEGTVK